MLPIPTTLSSSELKVLVPKRGSLLPGDMAKILLDYTRWLQLGPLARRGVTILAGVSGRDQQESIRAVVR